MTAYSFVSIEITILSKEDKKQQAKQQLKEIKKKYGLKVNKTLETPHEKTCFWRFRLGPSQTGLYSHRRWLET